MMTELTKDYKVAKDSKKKAQERNHARRQEFRRTEEGREYRNSERKRLYGRSVKHATNSRNPWSPEDIELILKRDITDFELSKKIGRTVQAIQGKRVKLKIESEK